jgi:hypothetical protein
MSEPAAGVRPPDRAAELVDELIPADVDWRPLVVRYPLTSLAVAAVGGFWLGRRRGAAILAGVATFAADSIESSVHRLLEAE